jgi:transposase
LSRAYRGHREAVLAEMRRRMSPPQQQSVAQISAELSIQLARLLQLEEGLRLLDKGCDGSQEGP